MLLYQGLAPAVRAVSSLADNTRLWIWACRIIVNVALRQLFSHHRRILSHAYRTLRALARFSLAPAASCAHIFENSSRPVALRFTARNVYARQRIGLVVGILLLSLGIARDAVATTTEEGVCDVRADYFLGNEDYAEAIRRHEEVLHQQPHNALAHYHLGFADGMMGRRTAEIAEYHLAEAQGLRTWDLFLNLGLAQFEEGDLAGAAVSLQRAVGLGGNHFESHFNLALIEERRGMLKDAWRETRAALRLSPREPEALNLLGVIYAREGEAVRAAGIFREIVREQPGYGPARMNLQMLEGDNESTAATKREPARTSPIAVGAVDDQGRSSTAALLGVADAEFKP